MVFGVTKTYTIVINNITYILNEFYYLVYAIGIGIFPIGYSLLAIPSQRAWGWWSPPAKGPEDGGRRLQRGPGMVERPAAEGAGGWGGAARGVALYIYTRIVGRASRGLDTFYRQIDR